MINTIEFRLGNIILFNDEPVEIMGIHTGSVLLDGVVHQAANGIDVEYEPIKVNDDRLQPVPLCDTLFSIIGKGRMDDEFGVQYQYYHNSSTYTVREDEDGYYIGLYTTDAPIHITPNHFHALHELQNIHFAQYSEEMAIDLKMLKRVFLKK